MLICSQPLYKQYWYMRLMQWMWCVQASQVDVECVRVTAMKSLFDLIHVFGLGAFEDPAEPDSDTTTNMEEGEADEETDNSRDLLQASVRSDSSLMEEAKEEQVESGWSKSASKLIEILSSALDSEVSCYSAVFFSCCTSFSQGHE